MTVRMKADERRNELLRIMREEYAGAKNQMEFTAAKVAGKAGVSVVWFYRKVGPEFQELRAQLEGPRRPKGTVISKLKGQIASLKKEVRELKASLKVAVLEQIAEAVRMIEMLDAENRMLRGEVKMLRQRLNESEIVIMPSTHVFGYQIKRHSFTSLNPN
jgi:predicted transcriptional regulator